MDNFFFGMQAISTDFFELLRHVTKFHLFWGIIIGFLLSTLVHAFLLSGNFKHAVCLMVDDHTQSFQKIYKGQTDPAVYNETFRAHTKKAHDLKIALRILGLLIALFLLLAITFSFV